MGDHFLLLVDRMLTESTLGAAIESKNSLKQAAVGDDNNTMMDCSIRKDSEGARKVVECRICQDEDVDLNMETPCSCSGSLKYAHRKCIQRWCNEKGDIMCEICHNQFKPGYTAPPPVFRLRRLPANLRGNWQIAGQDPNNPHIIAMVSTDQSLLDPDYDEYAASTLRSIVCCRFVAIILMILLIIRHTLPAIVSQAGNYSFTLLVLIMLRIAGILLPICIILRAVTSVLSRHRYVADVSDSASDEETTPYTLTQAHVIAIQ